MKNLEYKKIEDFINDSSFVNWATKKEMIDVEFWNQWLIDNPDKKQLVCDARDLVIGIKFNKKFISEEQTLAAWDDFEKKLEVSKRVKKIPFYKQRKYQGLAAAVLLFLVISIVGVISFSAAETIVHKTTFNEILDVKLPDGTQVKLNYNSTLSYEKNNVREVLLEGEAFFNVEKKPSTNAKFFVITEDLEVEVYGTAFNVNNRNTKTQVFLEEGQIALKLNNGLQKSMVPGDLISYSFETDRVLEEKKILRPELQTSWKNGSLIFDRSTLAYALAKIKDTYGISVVFNDNEIKNTLITGALPTQNLEMCIKIIEKSAQVTIVNRDNKLYIDKN